MLFALLSIAVVVVFGVMFIALSLRVKTNGRTQGERSDLPPDLLALVQQVFNDLGIDLPQTCIYVQSDAPFCAVESGMRDDPETGMFVHYSVFVISSALAEKLSTDQLRAVIAHEAAHVVCKHNGGGMLLLSALMRITEILLPVALAGLMIGTLFGGIDVGTATSMALGAIVWFTLYALGRYFYSRVSVRHEIAADAYAVRYVGNPQLLRDALRIHQEMLNSLPRRRWWLSSVRVWERKLLPSHPPTDARPIGF